jgi:hypothetical protein
MRYSKLFIISNEEALQLFDIVPGGENFVREHIYLYALVCCFQSLELAYFVDAEAAEHAD